MLLTQDQIRSIKSSYEDANHNCLIYKKLITNDDPERKEQKKAFNNIQTPDVFLHCLKCHSRLLTVCVPGYSFKVSGHDIGSSFKFSIGLIHWNNEEGLCRIDHSFMDNPTCNHWRTYGYISSATVLTVLGVDTIHKNSYINHTAKTDVSNFLISHNLFPYFINL